MEKKKSQLDSFQTSAMSRKCLPKLASKMAFYSRSHNCQAQTCSFADDWEIPFESQKYNIIVSDTGIRTFCLAFIKVK